MSTLLIFVLGILFIEFVIPIIEAIAVLIATALNKHARIYMINSKNIVEQAKINTEF